MKVLRVQEFISELQHIDPQFKAKKFLIAFSAGLDSTVLAYLAHQLGLDFSLAHVNYQLRAQDSDDDAQLAQDCANNWNVPLYLKTIETSKLKKSGESIQMLCRDVRYAFFQELKKEHSFDYVMTAHHADDDIENLLLNLAKAKALPSLAGIPEKNDWIIRPLLPFSKQSLKKFAEENQLNWREDQSNLENKYDRNFIRNEVIPLLERRFPEIRKNLSQSLQYLKEVQNDINEKLETEKKSLFRPYQNGFRLAVKDLQDFKDFQLHLLFQPFQFSNPNEIRKLLDAQSGSKMISSTNEIHKDRDSIYLFPKMNKNAPTEEKYTISVNEQMTFPIPLKIEKSDTVDSKATFTFDADKVELPLTLRHKEDGDLFYPNGMDGSKKLSKFFKDEKIPNFEKDKIWVLTDAKNRIIFVIPLRGDRRFAVNSETKEFINIYV